MTTIPNAFEHNEYFYRRNVSFQRVIYEYLFEFKEKAKEKDVSSV